MMDCRYSRVASNSRLRRDTCRVSTSSSFLAFRPVFFSFSGSDSSKSTRKNRSRLDPTNGITSRFTLMLWSLVLTWIPSRRSTASFLRAVWIAARRSASNPSRAILIKLKLAVPDGGSRKREVRPRNWSTSRLSLIRTPAGVYRFKSTRSASRNTVFGNCASWFSRDCSRGGSCSFSPMVNCIAGRAAVGFFR